MDKTILLMLPLGALFLAGCGLIGQETGPSPTELATLQAREIKVATLVQGTLEAAEKQTQTAPTLTPTPGTLPIASSLLDGDELNTLLDAWPPAASEQLNLTSEPLCIEDCAGRLWLAVDGSGQLVVRLYQTTGRDHAVTLLQALRKADGEAGRNEQPLPEISKLPIETWIVFDRDLGAYLLRTRQGKAIVELVLQIPHLDPEQNVLLLSLYGEQQVEKLKSSGF